MFGSGCGWNNQTCAFWPFLSSTEKADWQAECCTELNVLDGSTRERMCAWNAKDVDTHTHTETHRDTQTRFQRCFPNMNSLTLLLTATFAELNDIFICFNMSRDRFKRQ